MHWTVRQDQLRVWPHRNDGDVVLIKSKPPLRQVATGAGVLYYAVRGRQGAPSERVMLIPESLPALLRSQGPEREAASQELRDLLVRAALSYLARQQYPVEAFGADTYASIADDYAQEAFSIILRQLDSYRGECRFTTWAYRIVISLIADEMWRRCWRRRPLPEDTKVEPDWRTSTLQHDAAVVADRRALWQLIKVIIQNELTPRQRSALVGRIFEKKPLIVLAEELDTNKDNVYKLLHDARKHLKYALQERGITTADAFAAFEVSRY